MVVWKSSLLDQGSFQRYSQILSTAEAQIVKCVTSVIVARKRYVTAIM